MYRMGEEEIEAVAKVIRSKNLFKINDGDQNVMNFEQEWKAKLNTKNAILMTSGKAALISALVGMGIGPGDEVIVPGYTYIATAIAVTAVGAIPVIAEINDTLTLDPVDTEAKITPRTKAIIPVHIQGFPCDMDAIRAVAKKHNLVVLEDACQADGGSYKGKRLGTLGEAGAFSFNYFKIISAGEGGALVTDDPVIYQRALIHHDSSAIAYFGNQLEGVTEEQFCGTEFRSNEISAAILREQLKKLDGILADLRRNKKALMNAIGADYRFAPSNDIEGDCGTTLPVAFDTEADARRFAEKMKELGYKTTIPYDTGKHVYSRWTAVMNKRGAFHPGMDPFKMAENRDHLPDYREDMCPRTLELLARNVYIAINPDWTDADIAAIAAACKKAK